MPRVSVRERSVRFSTEPSLILAISSPERYSPESRNDRLEFGLAEQVKKLVLVLAYAQVKDWKDKTGKQDIERQAHFLKVINEKLSEQDIADLIGSSQPTVHRALNPEGKKKGEKSRGPDDSATSAKEGS